MLGFVCLYRCLVNAVHMVPSRTSVVEKVQSWTRVQLPGRFGLLYLVRIQFKLIPWTCKRVQRKVSFGCYKPNRLFVAFKSTDD